MYLLTIRAAVIIIAAAFVAAIAFALTFSVGTVWQMALLYSGGAFGLAIPFFNAIIPPAADPAPSPQEETAHGRPSQK